MTAATAPEPPTPPDLAARHAWLDLEQLDAERFAFVLTPDLSRFDGKLFGGTGLALTVAALEVASGRQALWATVQFARSADLGDRLDVDVDVVASGGTTTQARVTASLDGEVVFSALGATAATRADGFSAALHEMPDAPDPDDCGPLDLGFPEEFLVDLSQGPFALAEYREARVSGAHRVWARMRNQPQTSATLGFLADFVPSSVVHAAGRTGGGTSLDNAIRLGPPPPPNTTWVLLDFDPYFASNGYVHGAARIWSQDGTMLAVASQSAVARLFPTGDA